MDCQGLAYNSGSVMSRCKTRNRSVDHVESGLEVPQPSRKAMHVGCSLSGAPIDQSKSPDGQRVLRRFGKVGRGWLRSMRVKRRMRQSRHSVSKVSSRSSSQGRFKVISTRVCEDTVMRWTGCLAR